MPAPHAAIHLSGDMLDWHAAPAGDETYRAHMKNVFGIFQALLESHVPVEILTDDDLGDARALGRYSVLVLTNSLCLSDRQAAAIDAFVRAGGGLVATFETGTRDENGFRRGRSALADLLGAAQGELNKNAFSLPHKGGAQPPKGSAFYTGFRSEIVPLHGVRVAVSGKFASAKLFPEGKPVPVRFVGGASQVTVPKIDAHAMIVFVDPQSAP